MQRINIILFGFIIFLTACNSTESTLYIGEGESWSGEVKLASDRDSEDIMLEYKGDDVSDVGNFDFEIIGPNWGMKKGNADLTNGVFTEKGVNISDKNTSESAELTIIVDWNEKKETFHLKNEQ
jgi:hypothetical protein